MTTLENIFQFPQHKIIFIIIQVMSRKMFRYVSTFKNMYGY